MKAQNTARAGGEARASLGIMQPPPPPGLLLISLKRDLRSFLRSSSVHPSSSNESGKLGFIFGHASYACMHTCLRNHGCGPDVGVRGRRGVAAVAQMSAFSHAVKAPTQNPSLPCLLNSVVEVMIASRLTNDISNYSATPARHLKRGATFPPRSPLAQRPERCFAHMLRASNDPQNPHVARAHRRRRRASDPCESRGQFVISLLLVLLLWHTWFSMIRLCWPTYLLKHHARHLPKKYHAHTWCCRSNIWIDMGEFLVWALMLDRGGRD